MKRKGKRPRRANTGHGRTIERLRLIKRDDVDLDWHIPCSVVLPLNTTVQAGCTLATLIDALKIRGSKRQGRFE
jgi:hypothetical protein